MLTTELPEKVWEVVVRAVLARMAVGMVVATGEDTEAEEGASMEAGGGGGGPEAEERQGLATETVAWATAAMRTTNW